MAGGCTAAGMIAVEIAAGVAVNTATGVAAKVAAGVAVEIAAEVVAHVLGHVHVVDVAPKADQPRVVGTGGPVRSPPRAAQTMNTGVIVSAPETQVSNEAVHNERIARESQYSPPIRRLCFSITEQEETEEAEGS